MNILWIEDFGGTLSSGTETLELMFKGLLSFDDWDEDELSLIKKPSDLANYCLQLNSVHRIYLCRNYFDYLSFKANHSVINEIDVIITDIRLDNLATDAFNLDIPAAYTDKQKFHENGGFYIFNDLIHLGVPVERMCFMTGEKNSFKAFEAKCSEIYIPKVKAFEKNDADFEKLREWINDQASDYAILRRGIIKGCQDIAENLSSNKLAFNDFIGEPEKKVSLEDMRDYLEVLANFLPLREPDDKDTFYKLFIRTLAHEWEAAEPKKIRGLASIMKKTRNWITHNSSLFNSLDEKMSAYLFIINMRVMFSFSEAVQPYEKILLDLFAENTLSVEDLKVKTTNKLIPFSKAYLDLKNIALDERKDRHNNVRDGFYFDELANNLQESNSSFRNDKQLFAKFLYQMFWLTTSNPYISTGNRRNLLEIKFWNFKYTEKPYIFEIARHIYKHSFS